MWKEKYRGMGLNMNGTSIFTLQFADDQVIIAKSKNDLEEMTVKIKEEYEKWRLHMNISKIKYLCIGGNETVLNLTNNIKIESCKYYRYLGVDINREGRDSREIKYRICQEKKAVKLLNSIWWSKEMSIGKESIIYTTLL